MTEFFKRDFKDECSQIQGKHIFNCDILNQGDYEPGAETRRELW